MAKIEIEVSEKLLEFFKAYGVFVGMDAKQIIEKEVSTTRNAFIDAVSGPYIDEARLKKRYGLDKHS
jgi:hypothetical protein